MPKSNIVVEDIFITKNNETIEAVKVVIDQESNELVIIGSKKEDDEEKLIRQFLFGGNIFFGLLYMLCFTIDEIRLFSICMAMVLGGVLGLNDVFYFERKKGASLVGTLIHEKGLRNKIKKAYALIK